MSNAAQARESVFVDSPRLLAVAVEAIRQASIVGFDTEFVGESTYEPVLCLLQVATEAGVWIIDPLGHLDLRDLWAALTAPDVEIVAVAARQELLFCQRYADRLPATVFDPQVAAGLLGYSYPLSHTNLLQQVLGVRVIGGETFTDWRKRPLSHHQLEYAADDVRHLLALRETLVDRAAELQRLGWVREECARLAERTLREEREERWWRVSGASGLSPRDLAVLRALWRWRDRAARHADLPPKRVLSDDLMVAIVKRKPRTQSDLFALRGFDRPSLRREGEAMVTAVQSALDLPEDQLPPTMRRDDPPQLALLVQLISLLSNSLAAGQDIAPSLLATTSDLQDVVRWNLARDQEKPPPVLDGWRGEILREAVIDLLAGKTAVRVADAYAGQPISIIRSD